MGYTTEFKGAISVDPPLSKKEVALINNWAEIRHNDDPAGVYGGIEELAHLRQKSKTVYMQKATPFSVKMNQAQEEVPGLYCQWVASANGKKIKWDGGEKFYDSGDWMQFLVVHFIGPHPMAKGRHPVELGFLTGHKLTGIINAVGETASTDVWQLKVEGDEVSVRKGKWTGAAKVYVDTIKAKDGYIEPAEMMKFLPVGEEASKTVEYEAWAPLSKTVSTETEKEYLSYKERDLISPLVNQSQTNPSLTEKIAEEPVVVALRRAKGI